MRNKTNYTDYRQYSWSVYSSPHTFKEFLLNRSIYIVPYFLLSYLGSKKLSTMQEIVIKNQLYWLIFTILIILLLFVVFIDYFISKNTPRKIINYRISENGLSVDEKTTPLENLNKNHINKLLSNPNKFSAIKNNHIMIVLKARLKRIKLLFQNNTQQENFIKALNQYSKTNAG